MTTHALLSLRPPRPGFARFVYSVSDVVEMLEALWVPAVGAAKVQAAAEIQACLVAHGGLSAGAAGTRFVDAIAARSPKVARVVATPVAVKAAPSFRVGSGWCARCSGPVCGGGRFCGEC